MMPKKYRLPVNEFNEGFGRQTQTRRSGQLALKSKRSHLPFSRFGVIIGKKVDSRATRRNRIKRQIFRFLSERELYRRPGYDNLILVAAPHSGLTSEALLVALRSLFA